MGELIDPVLHIHKHPQNGISMHSAQANTMFLLFDLYPVLYPLKHLGIDKDYF
jgi:hypothetical protein